MATVFIANYVVIGYPMPCRLRVKSSCL